MEQPLQYNKDNLMEYFGNQYNPDHAGTFNGCMETLHRVLDEWLKNQVVQRVPNIKLDNLTLGTCFKFLDGKEVELEVGKTFQKCEIASIFTPMGAKFLFSFINERNRHVHDLSSYDLFYEFTKICFPLDKIDAEEPLAFFFTPQAINHVFVVDVDANTTKKIPEKRYLLTMRHLRNRQVDMESTDCHNADLILEFITIDEVHDEYTHKVIVHYGNRKFEIKLVKTCVFFFYHFFGGEAHAFRYFRFLPKALLKRVLKTPKKTNH